MVACINVKCRVLIKGPTAILLGLSKTLYTLSATHSMISHNLCSVLLIVCCLLDKGCLLQSHSLTPIAIVHRLFILNSLSYHLYDK